MNKFPAIQCNNCKKIIQSRYSGEFVTCDCFENSINNKGIYIDSTEYYTRIGGENYTVIDMGDNDDLQEQ